MHDSIYQFSDNTKTPSNSEVGGKGYSLIIMSQAGLAIPPGFVLAVPFFQPWIDSLKETTSWQAFLDADDHSMGDKITAVKQHCESLSLNKSQQTMLDRALSLHPEIKQFAVRSSSPEEDLAGASFAGGYETVLGVTPATMEHAIKVAFASCLDPRIFVYKKEQGFDTDDFSIAIVIMEQVASDIAGVGFSIDPISNDYDIAVFNANWGLGETVVSGLASPDHYAVDKIKNTVLEKRLGEKETSIWLLDDGGTEERADPRHDSLTLNDTQVLELTSELCRIEALYKRPMDIEWAYAGDQLFLLQARPITTCIPLPSGMTSNPGEVRHLYLDITLSVQGLEKPLCALGSDILKRFFMHGMTSVLGNTRPLNIKHGVLDVVDGKMIVNLSNLFSVIQKNSMANFIRNMDTIASDIIKQLNPGEYVTTPTPDALHIKKFTVFLHMYDVVFKIFTAKFRLNAMDKHYQHDVDTFHTLCDKILGSHEPLSRRIKKIIQPLALFILHKILPAMIVGQRAISAITALFEDDAKRDKEIATQVNAVSCSLPHNITIEMGLDIYKLSLLVDKNKYPSRQTLLNAFHAKQLGDPFYQGWHAFMERFGARGFEELNIASSRYIEDPALLIGQVYSMLSCDKENNPVTKYKASQQKRHTAYEFLLKLAEKKGKKTLKSFKSNYAAMLQFGGYRENHKYYLIITLNKIRQLMLSKAHKLVKRNILNDVNDVFKITVNDLKDLENDSNINLYERIEKNTHVIRQLEQIKRPPPVFDSRGRILQVKRPPLKENEIGGQAVSSGTVKGRVKVLHTPDEKPLLLNEILVARATDPGWTPLFVNAGAIVLEVGGMLQHGALVAREYGKPCVVGVDKATDILKDGDWIEIDGAAGIIRRLDKDSDEQAPT